MSSDNVDIDTISPICVIVLGMAGSGKTSLVSRLSHEELNHRRPYVINLDPACIAVPYFAHIDIRDTINYKEVMKQYKLGPNGAIVTALNLFSTKFHEVSEFISKSRTEHPFCVIDTPGQIEVFTWSVSGSIITQSLSTQYRTVVLYVMDCVRNTSPVTFMSNMLYACSILYKMQLPFVVVMNKIDIVRHEYALEWMRDFESFQQALDEATDEGNAYIGNLMRTLCLTLDEFYKNLKVCGVSAATGDGIDSLMATIQDESSTVLRSSSDKAIVTSDKSTSHDATDDPPFVERIPAGVENADLFLKACDGSSSSDSEGEECSAVDHLEQCQEAIDPTT